MCAMTRIASRVFRVAMGIRKAVSLFVIVAFVYMALAVFVQVLGRYIFNYPIAAAVETATWAQIWVVLLGAGLAMHRGMLVSIDFLAAKLPLRLARILSVIITGACVWFVGLVAWASKALIEIGQFETSATLLMPMWIIYLGLPIGAAYFAIELVLSMIARWNQPFGRREEASDIEGAA